MVQSSRNRIVWFVAKHTNRRSLSHGRIMVLYGVVTAIEIKLILPIWEKPMSCNIFLGMHCLRQCTRGKLQERLESSGVCGIRFCEGEGAIWAVLGKEESKLTRAAMTLLGSKACSARQKNFCFHISSVFLFLVNTYAKQNGVGNDAAEPPRCTLQVARFPPYSSCCSIDFLSRMG